MRGAHFAVVPRRREALEELIELTVAMRSRVGHRTCGKTSELMLDRPDLIEEPERVERDGDRAQPLLHHVRNRL